MMKTNKRIHLITLVFTAVSILLLASCSRYYYQPNAVSMPMLKDKNDANLAVNGRLGTGSADNNRDYSSVFNFHGAYSPVKYLGLMTTLSTYNYSMANEDPSTGDVDAYAMLFEGGVGGYYPIFERSNGLALIADTYVGYGGGRLNSDVNMRFNRTFIQPGIHLRFSFVDVGIALRYSGIKYTNFDANGMSEEYIENQGLTNITDGRKSFFEPAFTIRGGYKFIKGQFQIVGATPMHEDKWKSNKSLVTFGVFFSIDELIKFKNR